MDYTIYIHGGLGRTLDTIPIREFLFQLVPLIPYSAIAKTIFVIYLIFYILTRVNNQPLKQGLKQKLRIILKTYQTFLFR